MAATECDDLPLALARARARFQAWRGRRPAGERIPQPLWTLAVRLVNQHGVSRTASALGLDYYGLKKRVAAAGEAPANSSAFVELPAPLMVGQQCQFELNNSAGATMRVQLVGYDAAAVAAFACRVWNAE